MSFLDIRNFVGPMQPGSSYSNYADGTVEFRGRKYSFYDGGQTLFRINDTTSYAMAMLARTFPAELAKAMGSLGWIVRKKLREAIRAGGPPGTSWAKSADVGKLKQRGDRAWRTRASNPNAGSLFGHLYQAIGYKREKADLRVRIGWLSTESVRYAIWVQQGFSTSITTKMRRLFSARGLKLSGKGSVTTPPRPLVEPTHRNLEGQYVPYLEMKIASYLAERRLRGRAA